MMFDDEKLEAAVRDAIGRPEGDLVPADVAELTELTAYDVRHWGGLEHLSGLRELDLSFSKVRDLAPLAGLRNLEKLLLVSVPARDLTPLASLVALKELHLGGMPVRCLTPLASLLGLTALHLGGMPIRDLTPLAGLLGLKALHLTSMAVSDLTPLASLHDLADLSVNDTPVTDLTPLSGLENLATLRLSPSRVTDLAPLAQLPKLESLSLSCAAVGNLTPVSDIAPLAKLQSLRTLDLTHTRIRDLTPLAELRNLSSLDISFSRVSDLTPLARLSDLEELDLSSTPVRDLTPLAELSELWALELGSTRVDDLSPLAGLHELSILTLCQLRLRDLAPLAGLDKLRTLKLDSTLVSDVAPLGGLQSLRDLNLSSTQVMDLSPLTLLPSLEDLNLSSTPLAASIVDREKQAPAIDALEGKGVSIDWGELGDDQEDEEDEFDEGEDEEVSDEEEGEDEGEGEGEDEEEEEGNAAGAAGAGHAYVGSAAGYAPSELRDATRELRRREEDASFLQFGDEEAEFADLLTRSRRENLQARLAYCAQHRLLLPSEGFVESIVKTERHVVWAPRDGEPAFAYSIGLYYLHDLPEILLVDETGYYDVGDLASRINALADAMLSGRLRLQPRTPYAEALEACQIHPRTSLAKNWHFEEVDPEMAEDYLGFCSWFYGNFMDNLGGYPALVCRLHAEGVPDVEDDNGDEIFDDDDDETFDDDDVAFDGDEVFDDDEAETSRQVLLFKLQDFSILPSLLRICLDAAGSNQTVEEFEKLVFVLTHQDNEPLPEDDSPACPDAFMNGVARCLYALDEWSDLVPPQAGQYRYHSVSSWMSMSELAALLRKDGFEVVTAEDWLSQSKYQPTNTHNFTRAKLAALRDGIYSKQVPFEDARAYQYIMLGKGEPPDFVSDVFRRYLSQADDPRAWNDLDRRRVDVLVKADALELASPVSWEDPLQHWMPELERRGMSREWALRALFRRGYVTWSEQVLLVAHWEELWSWIAEGDDATRTKAERILRKAVSVVQEELEVELPASMVSSRAVGRTP